MKAYALTLVLGLACVATFNLAVDRGGLGNYAVSYRLSAQQRANEVLVSDKAIDQRAVLKQRLLANAPPELLVLGSSTVGGLAGELFAGRRFYNGWLSEVMPEDLEAVTALIQQRGAAPRTIVLGVDAWYFNDKVRNDRWISISDEQAAFLRRNRQLARWVEGTRSVWRRLRELLSFETTVATVRYLEQRSARAGIVDSVWLAAVDLTTTCPAATNELQIRFYDGHFVGCTQFLLSGERLREVARSYVQRDFHLMRSWRGVSSERLDRLERVIAAWRQMGIRVILLVPPYHPDTYAELMRNISISNNLGDLDRRLTALASGHQALLINLRNPAVARCEANEFTDSHHEARSCLAKVAATIAPHLE